MSAGLSFERGAIRDLRRLDHGMSERMIARLEWLAEHTEEVSHERLKGSLGAIFKFRVGAYRALYTMGDSGTEIVVLAVKHRREVYE